MADDDLILLDGAMGTCLIDRGVDCSGRGWSAEAVRSAPHIVLELHTEYALAGADVLTAVTFRTTERACGGDWRRLLNSAVVLAHEAAKPSGARVAGSLAPVEDCYRPDLSPTDAPAQHARTADALAEAGCDIILCETFPHAGEARAAAEAAARTGVETWVSLTPGPDHALLTGCALTDAAARLTDSGAQAVLVNCGPSDRALDDLRAIRAGVGAGRVRIGVFANAGPKQGGLGWGAGGESAFAQLAAGWRDAGAAIVGGCCGTTPAHIAAAAARLGRPANR